MKRTTIYSAATFALDRSKALAEIAGEIDKALKGNTTGTFTVSIERTMPEEMTLHPFWQLCQIPEEHRSDADRIAIIAVAILSSKDGYRELTPEQIYDRVMRRHGEVRDAGREMSFLEDRRHGKPSPALLDPGNTHNGPRK